MARVTSTPFETRRKLLLGAGSALATLALPGCGGTGDDTPPPGNGKTPPPLQVKTFSGTGSTQVQVGRHYQVDTLLAAGGKLTEQAVRTPSGEHRLFYDGHGRLVTFRHADGRSIRMSYPGYGRVDLEVANAGGVRQAGMSLYVDGSDLRVAPLGSALTGQQINATLSGPIQGALTVSPDPSDTLAGIDRSAAVTLDATVVATLLQGVAAAQAAPADTKAALAASGTQIARGIANAGVLGTVLVLGGLAAPAVFGALGLSTMLGAVVGGVSVAYGLRSWAEGIGDIQEGAVRRLLDNGVDAAREDGATEASVFDRLQSGARSLLDTGQVAAAKALDVARSAAGTADRLAPQLGLNTLPALSGALADVASSVRGALVDSAGRLFTGSGTLGKAGALTLDLATSTGTRTTVQAQRSGTTLTGSYSINGRAGSVNGTQAAVGNCNVSSRSGGAGTFSYSYNVGSGQSSFPFNYQMYGVPDQARIVDIAGRELYNTGGLVSGSGSVQVALRGEPNVVVLINAPNSGTAWDFQIGCGN